MSSKVTHEDLAVLKRALIDEVDAANDETKAEISSIKKTLVEGFKKESPWAFWFKSFGALGLFIAWLWQSNVQSKATDDYQDFNTMFQKLMTFQTMQEMMDFEAMHFNVKRRPNPSPSDNLQETEIGPYRQSMFNYAYWTNGILFRDDSMILTYYGDNEISIHPQSMQHDWQHKLEQDMEIAENTGNIEPLKNDYGFMKRKYLSGPAKRQRELLNNYDKVLRKNREEAEKNYNRLYKLSYFLIAIGFIVQHRERISKVKSVKSLPASEKKEIKENFSKKFKTK